MKISVKDFFDKCESIRTFMRKKVLTGKFIFCALICASK